MVVALSNPPAGSANSGRPASSKVLLRVTDLKVTIPIGPDHQVNPVSGVSFDIANGEAVGLLGESGAGKTTLARALLRLLPPTSQVDGAIEFDGLSVLRLGNKALRSVRGSRISLVHQDSSVLNPVRRVGDQIVDVLRAHGDWSRLQCREAVFSLLQQMHFEHVARIYSAYPHQLSGGERQRIVVAQALICRPSLVIADEPTASVDSETASQILRLFKDAKEILGSSILLISHDVNVLAQVADTIMVMRAGRIVEHGPVRTVLNQPSHPYTCALLKCSDLAKYDRRNQIDSLPLPTAMEAPPESPLTQDDVLRRAEADCAESIDLCAADIPAGRCRGMNNLQPITSNAVVRESEAPNPAYIVQAIGLSKSYRQRSGWCRKPLVQALDSVNLALPRGNTVAIVGKSGSGKTTLAMCLALLEKSDGGDIIVEGAGIQTLSRANRRTMRRQIQIIFQDSVMALSPRLTTIQLVEEPLTIADRVPRELRRQLARTLLEQVGITAAHYSHRPHELSGGQRQRVAIARSLALSPSLLILDEPFVGLDAPIRNQIVNLLLELQKIHNLTYLYISHDLALVRYFADAILTMDHGKLIPLDDTRGCSS